VLRFIPKPISIEAPAARRAAVLDVARAQTRTHADAFFVVDLPEIAHKLNEWYSLLPRVRPYYAVKCNDDPRIVATLARLGTGFDCATKGEMAMVLAQGVSAEDIIFAHPAKQASHIRYARSVGVSKMTFDNEEELRKIGREFPSAQAVLRILTDDSHSVCRLGLKFGAPVADVRRLLTVAREIGVQVLGVSYHVGSGNGNAASFADAVDEARAAFDVAESMGMRMKVLDIGGGFPGSTLGSDLTVEGEEVGAAGKKAVDSENPYSKHPSFRVIATAVAAALDKHFPVGCGVTLIAEPGRFFVKSSHTLAVNIVGKRTTADEASAKPRFNYYVNDGLYGSFNCIMYDHVTMSPDRLLPGLGSERPEMDLAALAEAQVAGAAEADPESATRDAEDVAAAYAFGPSFPPSRATFTKTGHRSTPPVHHAAKGASASMHAHARGVTTDAHSRPAPPVVHPTTIWGPTCDSIDKITDSARLPELAVGDWLLFDNAGAYTIAGSCQFNGFPLTTKVYRHLDGSIEVQEETS